MLMAIMEYPKIPKIRQSHEPVTTEEALQSQTKRAMSVEILYDTIRDAKLMCDQKPSPYKSLLLTRPTCRIPEILLRRVVVIVA